MIDLRKLSLPLATLAAVAVGPKAQALPEMARFGYFSCATCHVSPDGGGIQTPYGRALSAERLSTWSSKNEEQPLEGAIKSTPDWLLLGGDIRYAQVYTETHTTRQAQWIRMQSDLAAAVVLPYVTIVGQGGPHGTMVGDPNVSGKWSWRDYYAKVDLPADVSVRYGRFYPRYGLMIPEHVSNIRSGLYFDEGMENSNAEVVWTTESSEVALTRMFGIRPGEVDGSRELGYTANWAYSLFNKHRVGLSLLRGEMPDGTRRVAYGASGIFSLSDRWFLESEVDHQTLIPPPGSTNPKDQLFVYNRLGFEPIKGLVPFIHAEQTSPDVRQPLQRQDEYGLGAQWFPRPHFDFEAELGTVLNHMTATFSTMGYLIAHYYL